MPRRCSCSRGTLQRHGSRQSIPARGIPACLETSTPCSLHPTRRRRAVGVGGGRCAAHSLRRGRRSARSPAAASARRRATGVKTWPFEGGQHEDRAGVAHDQFAHLGARVERGLVVGSALVGAQVGAERRELARVQHAEAVGVRDVFAHRRAARPTAESRSRRARARARAPRSRRSRRSRTCPRGAAAACPASATAPSQRRPGRGGDPPHARSSRTAACSRVESPLRAA